MFLRACSSVSSSCSAIHPPSNLSFYQCIIDVCVSPLGIVDELIRSKRLAGSIVGGYHERGQYVPEIYTRSQNEWVDSFYRQNGYLGWWILISFFRLSIVLLESYVEFPSAIQSMMHCPDSASLMANPTSRSDSRERNWFI